MMHVEGVHVCAIVRAMIRFRKLLNVLETASAMKISRAANDD